MFVLIAALASTLQLASAEPAATAAPIPIDGPITISQSGDYIVTRDFTAVSVPAIELSGSPIVTIDFDGHRVEGRISLRETPAFGDNRTLTIKNGELVGNIAAFSSRGHGGHSLTIDNMTLTNSAVWVEDGLVVATHSRFVNSSITAFGNFGSPSLGVADSEMIGGSINGRGSRCSVVRNEIWNGSILLGTSDMGGSSGGLAGNVVQNGNIEVSRISGSVEIVGNDVSGYIRLTETSDSMVYGNVIRGCFTTGSAVTVDVPPSRRNQIVHNEFLGGCDHGIYFGYGAENNVYTDNHFQFPVPQPIVDLGENNHRGPSVDVGPE